MVKCLDYENLQLMNGHYITMQTNPAVCNNNYNMSLEVFQPLLPTFCSVISQLCPFYCNIQISWNVHVVVSGMGLAWCSGLSED